MDQQIAAVRAALAAIESAIDQTQATLAKTTNPQDVAALRAVLVDLRAERANLQLQLANLEAASVEVQPLGGPPAGKGLAGAAGRRVVKMTPGQSARIKKLEKMSRPRPPTEPSRKPRSRTRRTCWSRRPRFEGLARASRREPAPKAAGRSGKPHW